MKKLFPLIFYLISVVLIAQPESYIKFPHQSDNSSITFSQLISVDDALLIFYADSNKLMLSKSLDEGTNWQEPEILYDSLKIEDPNLSAIRLKSGRILISYNENPTRLIYSDDNAISWSESIDMNLGFAVVNIKNPSFVEINNQVWYYFNITNRIYYSSSIDGISWDGNRTKISDLDYNYKTSIESYENNAVAILNITEDNFNKLYFSVSTDSAKSWNEKQLLINSNSELQNSILKITEEGILYLFYEEVSSPFHESIYSPDIKYINANINDLIWSEPIKITNYVGNDNLQSAVNYNNNFYLSFGSSRSNILLANSHNSIQFDNIGDFNFLSDDYDSELFVGKLNYSNDLLTPPLISELNTHFYFYYPKSSFVLRAVVIDDNEVNNVKVNLTINNNKSFHLEMNDTGINGDEISFDNIYSVRIDSLNIDDSLKINLLAADVNENTVLTDTITLVPRFYNPNNAYLIDVNKISIPIDNKGIIGNVTIYDTLGNSRAGGHFEEGVFVYSGGFMLSGYLNGKLWANGVASSSRIDDYKPGKINSDPADWKNIIYVVKSSDPPFSVSWNNWVFAVQQGADFYDGDNDGIYNPTDKNNNGIWDTNEDKPNLIGDITAWSIYNDGVSSELRRFDDVSPMGIEIAQTTFAYSPETFSELANVVFFKYKINNTGIVSDVLNSVYFSPWSDPDLGDYTDDLIGSDTLLNTIYCYDNNIDADYGNSPAFFTSLIQGPVSYIPNVSFIDQNNNNIYDEGIDTPLDTAKQNINYNIEPKFYPGALNLNLHSAVNWIHSDPVRGDPDSKFELRNYMNGKNRIGYLLNPCIDEFGQVLGIECDLINPLFWYSGDPVTSYGWVSVGGNDQVMMSNVGPFKLEKDKPQEIIVAYVLGRGNASLQSIDVTREITKDVLEFYNSNFTEIPVSVAQNKNENIPSNFVLEQNYPNPFNPTTTIKYTIPNFVISNPQRGERSPGSEISPNIRNDNANVETHSHASVRLVVYDILGREVATLVNQKQKPGNYEINFDASKYSSGVYYYQLKVGQFIHTKKMLLLK